MYIYIGMCVYVFSCLFLSHRHMVPVPPGVSALPGSDPTVGSGGPTEPSDQGGSPLRVAACYSSYVN